MLFKSKRKPPETIDVMEASLYPVVAIPFGGTTTLPTLKTLSHVEVKSCGDFSLIETIQDNINKKGKEPSFDEISQYAETQYNILKYSLISPTYDEIMDMAQKRIDIEPIKKTMDEIESKFHMMPMSPEKKQLQEEYAKLEMRSKFLLPADFVGGVVSFALKVDETDIKLITEDILFEAAIKAVKGHDNPSDHIHGIFTDFNKEDLNNRAWIIYYDKIESKRK